MTVAGSDLADPAEVLSLSHPVRLDSGSSRGGESREVKKQRLNEETPELLKGDIVVIPHAEAVRVHSPPLGPPVPGITVSGFVSALLRHVSGQLLLQ